MQAAGRFTSAWCLPLSRALGMLSHRLDGTALAAVSLQLISILTLL